MRTGNLCNKMGKIPYGTSINKPSDIIHHEASCWTDQEIQKTSYNVHFSVVKAWQGKLLLDSGLQIIP
jgi:hypothetical protein